MMKLDKRHYSKLVDKMLDKAYYVKPSVVNGKIDYRSCFTKQLYEVPVGGVIFDKDDTEYWNFGMNPLVDPSDMHPIGVLVQGVYEYDYQDWIGDLGWYRFNQKQETKLQKVMDFWKQKYPDPYFLENEPYWKQKLS